MWYIGNSNTGVGYKDHGPFASEDDAYVYASETGLDKDDPNFEVWQDDEDGS